MLKPQYCPQYLNHQANSLQETFSILVWNVHKENQNSIFKQKLNQFLLDNPSDFLLFQEFKYPKSSPCKLYDYSYALSSNIETKKHLYGVLTATKCAFENIECKLSKNKEMGLVTHKSFIISQHLLPLKRLLYIVNIHAINFVSSKQFTQELEEIKQNLLKHQGPMIVVGDFNNWSDKRVDKLDHFQNELNLTKAEVNMSHHIKHVFHKPLDHIFYRDLNLAQAEAIDTQQVSDHNPIYATFKSQ